MTRLLPPGCTVPPPLRTAEFVFEVLGPEHNERDHLAWTQSIEHIRSTPGFASRQWPPDGMTLSQNLRDLEWHREEYTRRASFAYAVLAASDGAYVGCVYFSPPTRAEFDVDVASWVRKERADLDAPLHAAVRSWLDDEWPWTRPDHTDR
jgi:RimJ/RimL family protein N-acetyltransferase